MSKNIIFLLILGLLAPVLLHAQPPFVINYQARQAVANSDYLTATNLLVRSLTIEPKRNNQAKKLLVAIAPEMSQANTERLDLLVGDIETFKGDTTVAECEEIIRTCQGATTVVGEFSRLPEAARVYRGEAIRFGGPDYQTLQLNAEAKLVEAKEQAAEMHFRRGQELLAAGGMMNARTAAREFEKALSYSPDYPGAQAAFEEAVQIGTKRIAILPFADQRFQYLGPLGSILTERTIARLLKGNLLFVELVPSRELESILHQNGGMFTTESLITAGRQLELDEIWTGQITLVDTGAIDITFQNRTSTANVVIRTTTVTNERGEPIEKEIRGDVEARFRRYTRKNQTQINCTYEVIDLAEADVQDNPVSRSLSWQDSWDVRTGGDERAFNPVVEGTPPPNGLVRCRMVAEAHGNNLARSIERQETRLNVPVIKAVTELGTNLDGAYEARE